MRKETKEFFKQHLSTTINFASMVNVSNLHAMNPMPVPEKYPPFVVVNVLDRKKGEPLIMRGSEYYKKLQKSRERRG